MMANEKRLIDANELEHKMFYVEEKNGGHGWVISLEDLSKAPTVDAVEVVRCKDCKHWECWRNSGEGSGDCHLDEGYATLATQHYDFCSYGERKDKE